MKKSLFSIIASLFISNLAFSMGTTTARATSGDTATATSVAVSTTAVPTPGQADIINSSTTIKNKIIISETQGLLYEIKKDGKIVKLDNEIFNKMKNLSLEEAKEKMKSNNGEESFFANFRYHTTPGRYTFNLGDEADWNDVIKKLIIDLYWTTEDGSGDYAFAKAYTTVFLIFLENKTVEYFEKNDLRLYKDENLKAEIMMNVLNYIAKERKDLIPRIKALVDPIKFQDDPEIQETANHLIDMIDKY